jgi:hypothetical protein
MIQCGLEVRLSGFRADLGYPDVFFCDFFELGFAQPRQVLGKGLVLRVEAITHTSQDRSLKKKGPARRSVRSKKTARGSDVKFT